jgi:hypothetical protein
VPPRFRCRAGAAIVAAIVIASPASAAVIAGFENLPSLPGPASQTGLFFANNDSPDYAGVTWDRRTRVVGADYRIDTGTPGPLYGVAHAGRYYITNEGDGTGNDGLLLTTAQVLTGAWFGRNTYYGFDAGGADQITIRALQGTAVLASVVFDLPEALAGLPEPLSYVDTSAFAALTGITGYRIDRRELGTPFGGNWVADDFTFADAANVVPEPGTWALLLAGLGGLVWGRRRGRFHTAA